MIHPDRSFKHCWDVFVTILIVGTGFEVPLRLAFVYSLAGWVLVWNLFVVLVFIADIVITFNTAQFSKARLQTERPEIARRYLKSWFAVDLISALPLDLLFLGLALASGPAVRFAALLRAVRLIKIPVLLKQFRRWETLYVLNPNVLRLIFSLIVVSLLAHWVACGWFILGGAAGQTGDGLAIYLYSLYWAVTTLTTVGYGDITPSGNLQMIYTMGVMFLGVGMYAYVIGTIVKLITDADHARIQHRERLDRINVFMKYHDVPLELQKRIRDYYQYLWESRLGMDEATATSDLSDSLNSEVALFLLRDMLRSASLFREAGPEILKYLVVRLQPCVYSPGDYIVRKGEIGDRMFFISKGAVEVVGDEGETVISTLNEGGCFGEIALLFEEKRNATVRAVEYVDLYSLDKQSFNQALSHFPKFAERVRRIAEERKDKANAESA